MDGESVFGCIILLLCSLICSCAFLGIGIWARKSKKPMSFYSGTEIDPKTVTDIAAYNLENSRMWIRYSIAYWLSAGCSVAGFIDARILMLSVFFLMFAGTAGIAWLILRYKKISKRYIIR